MNSRYLVVQLGVRRLESFLNDLENFATGAYEIVSIISMQPPHGPSPEVAVVVKLQVKDPEFDEDLIKQKLGI